MEAPSLLKPAAAGFVFGLSFLAAMAGAAEYRTTNFVVSAPTAEIAQQVGDTAEQCRHDLAMEWLGRTLPNWYRPCPIKVQVGQMGAGGATTFTFDRGEVSGWNMRVQGTLERVLDSVIPHEVSHTIFASHFRRPLPRWADEGAATLIEHADERKRQDVLLERVIQTSKRIPLDRLLSMSEYPTDMQQVYTLYAEGYSLANFLVQQHGPQGKAVYLQFLEDAHRQDWKHAIQKHYQYGSVGELEQHWTGWVLAGSPPRQRREGESLASHTVPPTTADQPGQAVATPRTPTDNQLALASGHPRGPAQNAHQNVAGFPPLAPIARALRQPEGTPGVNPAVVNDSRTASLNAAPYIRGSSSSSEGRVTPRVTPFPGRDLAANRRMQQIREETLAAARRGEQLASQQVNTARTADPASEAVLRGQSPEEKHWGDFAGYPQQSAADSTTDPQGRRIPFAN